SVRATRPRSRSTTHQPQLITTSASSTAAWARSPRACESFAVQRCWKRIQRSLSSVGRPFGKDDDLGKLRLPYYRFPPTGSYVGFGHDYFLGSPTSTTSAGIIS